MRPPSPGSMSSDTPPRGTPWGGPRIPRLRVPPSRGSNWKLSMPARKVAGGGARREGWQEGLWCTHVAAVARATGDALAHSGHPLGNGPVQCVVA